jgi:RNA polymerase sigma factor (sigma-70 family)
VSHNAESLDELYAAYAAASGEDKSKRLAQLVESMRKSAWAITYRVLGQALPDVVNDSVTGAIQTLHTFQGKARFSTWFYSVVQIHCKMALMAKLSRPPEISLEQLAEEGGEPAIEVTSADNAKIDLNNILEELDPEDRRLMALKAEGRTYVEIAEILGLKSWQAANSRWRRLTARIEREKRVQAQRSRLAAGSAG